MSGLPTARLRYVAEINPSVRSNLPEDTSVSFLPMDAIAEYGELDLSRVRQVSEVKAGYSYFENGDVAFAKVTPCFENGKGAVFRDLVAGVGFGTTELTVLRPKHESSARFLSYVLQSSDFRQMGIASMTGAGGLKRVSEDAVRDFVTFWPDLAHQERIANFLDDKTVRIDALIAEKERLVSALGSYQSAEISRLLCVGVGGAVICETGKPLVPLAPSHWRVVALKRALLGINQGWSPQCENQPAENGQWGVLKVGCVNGTSFNPMENKALPSTLEPDLSCVLRKNDVLVSRANTRELVGLAALVEDDYPNLMLCDKLYRLDLRSDWLLPGYAVLLLRSEQSRRQIELGASGASSSMQNISQDVLRELVVAIPPLDEQLEILATAKAVRSSCSTLSEHAVLHIARLREYRSSLISSAVTGQLDLNTTAVNA